MGIRILQMKVEGMEFENWLKNDEFVSLTTEVCLSSKEATRFYNEDLNKYCKRHHNDRYYTFDEWRKEHKIFTKSELNLYYGSDNWHYGVVEDDNFDPQWLIIALIEKND